MKSRKNAILRVCIKTLRHCSLQLHVLSKYWPIDYYTVHTVWLIRRTKPRSSSFFIFFQSFTQVNNTEPEKIKIPKSLNPCSPLSRASSSNQPSVHHQQATTVFFTSHREVQISDNNSGGSPVTSLHQP